MEYLKVKDLGKGGAMLAPAKVGDAGYDVIAIEDIDLCPGERFKMNLGIAIEIPNGYVAIVNAKSGRATKEGLTTIGNVIDSGYRGEISACLVNTHKNNCINIKNGEKVAQILFHKCYTPKIEMVKELSETDRGKSGFGSTGLKIPNESIKIRNTEA